MGITQTSILALTLLVQMSQASIANASECDQWSDEPHVLGFSGVELGMKLRDIEYQTSEPEDESQREIDGVTVRKVKTVGPTGSHPGLSIEFVECSKTRIIVGIMSSEGSFTNPPSYVDWKKSSIIELSIYGSVKFYVDYRNINVAEVVKAKTDPSGSYTYDSAIVGRWCRVISEVCRTYGWQNYFVRRK